MNYKILSGVILTSTVLLSALGQTNMSADTIAQTVNETTYTIEQKADKLIQGPIAEPNESVDEAISIGESKAIDNLTFTLDKVESTDKNQSSDIVTLYYTVTNRSSDGYFAGEDATIYLNGKKAGAYALGTDKLKNIQPGRTFQASESFRVPKEAKSFEVELGPVFDISGKKALYKVTEQ
ncbi:hypothetical protein [Macrococcus carouselicus]|uniref:DUF4352 domain-containing protein n=1 Tax=Macrococcus carouselicus TaxID=69969 RepID=A0A9Q8CMM3_9STAP|nr:hypothetical protein [Macrococcus carouselicus]TDM04153.1 hypothetical protein ERX40_03005 [Macrococcus carouselicus]